MNLHWQRISPDEWRAGDYMITRWYAPDRGNRVRQYQAIWRPAVQPYTGRLWEGPGWNVGRTQEPFRELDAAKRACQQHADRLTCSAGYPEVV